MSAEDVNPQQPPPVEMHGTIRTRGSLSDDILDFRPADGAQAMELSIDPARFGFRSKAALHWAAMLESPLILYLRPDPQQPDGIAKSRFNEAILAHFKRADSRTTAQQLYDHQNGVVLIQRLHGLIKYRVTTAVPSLRSQQHNDFVDMRDVIVWRDDSVTITEAARSPFNGAIGPAHLLPPLQSIRETLQLPLADDEPFDELKKSAVIRDMVDFANIVQSANSLADRLNTESEHQGHPVFRSLIGPAAAAAYQYQQLLIEFMASDEFSNLS